MRGRWQTARKRWMTEGAIPPSEAPSVADFALRASAAPPPPLRFACMGGKSLAGLIFVTDRLCVTVFGRLSLDQLHAAEVGFGVAAIGENGADGNGFACHALELGMTI